MITLLIELGRSLTILVALSIASGLLPRDPERKIRAAVLQGVFFGCASLIGMKFPLILGPGLIFDGRSIMISLCGLFFGPLAGAIAGVITIIYRVSLGGAGLYMGIGVIISSTLFGATAYFRWRRRGLPITAKRLLLLGVVVHAAMVLLMFTVRGGLGMQTFKQLGLPVLTIYPLVTLLIGTVLTNQELQILTAKALRKSEAKYRCIVDTSNEGIWMLGEDLLTTFVNARMAEMLGYRQEEMLGRPQSDFMFEEDIPDHRQKIDNRRQGLSEQYERRFRRKDGQTVWMLVSASPIFEEHQQHRGSIVAMLSDITERKHAEQTLVGSEKLFRAIAETVPMMIIMWTGYDRTNAYFNPGIYRLSGYSPEELPNVAAWWPLAYPDPAYRKSLWNEWRSRTARAIATRGSIEPMEAEVTCKDGSKKYVSWGFVSTGEQNISFGIDLTERKRAEEALRRLNRELCAISYCNQTLLRATDEQTLVSEICRIVCEEAGYRMAWVGYAEQDEAKTVRPVAWAGIEDGYLDTADISWSEETEGGRGPTGHAIRSRKSCYNQDSASDDRSSPWRELALQRGYRSSIALPLKDEHASAFGALTIYSSEPNAFSPEEIRLLEELAADLAFGITVIRARIERERAEEMLALRSFALNSVREAALLIDEQGRLRDVNDWCCRLLGYSRDQLLEAGVPDFDPEMPAERWQEHWADLKAHRSLTFERELRSKEGRIASVEVNANYFEYDGIAYNIALVRDITERKRAEEEKAKLQQDLHQAQKMEAIGQLAGGVAHDFNNILGIINGYSEILLNERDLKEAQRASLEEILAAGQRAASLTRQLLAFSRKLVLQPKVLSLNSVIEGFDKMLRRLIGDEIEVRTVLDPTLSAVNADPNQIEQVLLNFCINARDAMPEGGRITIETANWELDEAMATHHLKDHTGGFPCPICGAEFLPGRYVTLSVSDTGIGMNQETMSHIFEPFFTTKETEHGTGLGLTTVYGIVKQSGGHVSVYSEPGQGTTFRVYLPAVSQETREREQITAPLELLRGTETILLVEDAAPLRTLYLKLLEDRGYTVLEAGDGERAIQIAERYRGEIALLLTDVSLPKIKGPALAKILSQQRPTIKVLFMSGHGDEVVSGPNHLLPAGTGFLQKPFGAEELFRRIREILDRQKPSIAA